MKRLRRSPISWSSSTSRFASTCSDRSRVAMTARIATWISWWWSQTMHPRTNCVPARGGEQCVEPGSPRTSCRGARPISSSGRLGSGRPCQPPSSAKESCSMTPSEARARESREWLAKADEDLSSARVPIGSGHIANALFFCQQAAGKSLKAFPTWHERAFRRTHDLEELGEACRAIDGTLAALLEQADVLSDFAWKLRYPGAIYTPEREEAEAMFGIASGIFREIQSRLPLETRTSEDHGDRQA